MAYICIGYCLTVPDFFIQSWPMKNSKIFLCACLCGMITNALAQVPKPDQQRYLALNMLNLGEEPGYGLDIIERTANLGFNSALITVAWDRVYRTQNSAAFWDNTDRQLELCKRLGLKVGLRVYVGRDHNAIAGFWRDEECTKDPTGLSLREIYNKTMFSLAHKPSVDKARNFVTEVCTRYSKYQQSGQLLWVMVVQTPTQENGYHYNNLPISNDYAKRQPTVYDYSEPMVQEFRNWCRTTYDKIGRLNAKWGSDFNNFEEVYPPFNTGDPMHTFFARRGKDWYVFRHTILKKYCEDMAKTIRTVNPNVAVLNEFGSVFDQSSGLRGTYAFQDLSVNTDGIKINDGQEFDHKWSMDLVRSNLAPNKWLMNEVFYDGFSSNADYIGQFDENYEHGAQLVCFVLALMTQVEKVASIIPTVATKWLRKPNVPIVPKATMSYRLSRILDSDYLKSGIYGEWLQKGGGAHVEVKLIEDLINFDYKALNNPPIVERPLPDAVAIVGQPFQYTVASDLFNDPDGYIAKIEARNLPSWLRFSLSEFSGTPTTAGVFQIPIRGVDDEGAGVEVVLTLRVEAAQFSFELRQAGPPGVRKILQTLQNNDIVAGLKASDKLNVAVAANFPFDSATLDLQGPLKYAKTGNKFPFLLLDGDEGFMATAGNYTFRANGYLKKKLVNSALINFKIVSDQPISDWVVYPNPVEQVFSLKFPATENPALWEYSITSANGVRQGISLKNNTIRESTVYIDLQNLNLPAGTYLLSVLQADKKSEKVIKIVKK